MPTPKNFAFFIVAMFVSQLSFALPNMSALIQSTDLTNHIQNAKLHNQKTAKPAVKKTIEPPFIILKTANLIKSMDNYLETVIEHDSAMQIKIADTKNIKACAGNSACNANEFTIK